uniref:Transcription factor SPT20 homolog n=1 Tax=Angiostrongylus cantonensis TaxID=6313 RepID=A0A158PC65_ANGCA
MHAPRHRAKVSYDKGRCVPVGWKPLVVDPRVRSYIYARAKRTCLEARDREAQRRAAEERQRERQQMRERVDEDLEACEAELERVKARRDELAAEKHECFTKLKACLQRESMQKKAEDEKKRRELLTLQMQQPFLAATIQAQAQVQAQAQANSLISNQHLLTQQNLLSQHFNAQSLLNQQALLQHQQLLAAQKLQELAQQRSLVQQQQQQQQQSTPQATAQQSIPAGISPAYLQQALGQVQPNTSQAQQSHVKLEVPSPQVSPSPQTLNQQPYGLQNLPALYSYKIVGAKPVLFKVQKMDPPKEAEPFDETNPLDFTMCEICSGGQNEELLLICDQCDKGDYSNEDITEDEYYEQDEEEEEADNESVSSHEQKSKRPTKVEDTLISSISRRGARREPVTRLSLLGAELEPVVDPQVTENSRRFDQPLSHRKETVEDAKPTVDSCDLLGSIIPEQVKTLAPGRLFAVKGGRFNSTKYFEQYRIKKTNQLSLELRERLGITTNSEGPSTTASVTTSPKENYSNDTKKLLSFDEGYRSKSSSTQTVRISPLNSDQSKKDRKNHGENKMSSVTSKKHQHLNQELNESKEQCFVEGTTDKYHQQDFGNHYKHQSRNENPYENQTVRKDIHQESRETDPGKHRRHFYAKERHFCERSKDFHGNEESEQEDPGSFMNLDMNERTVADPIGCVGVTRHEFQSPSLAKSLEPSSPVSKDLIASKSKERKDKPDDILRIIDEFAKEGIKPFKR